MSRRLKKENNTQKLLLILAFVATFLLYANSTGLFIGEATQVLSNVPSQHVFSHDFEDNTLGPLSTEGDAFWNVVSSGGNHFAQSGKISHGQKSAMSVCVVPDFSYNCSNGNYIIYMPAAGFITFSVKVSTEQSYDYLGFYRNAPLANVNIGPGTLIDTKTPLGPIKIGTPPFNSDFVLLDSWSGELDWREVTYPLPKGWHRLYWIYEKDVSNSEGQDAAWIDNVKISSVNAPKICVYESSGFQWGGWNCGRLKV